MSEGREEHLCEKDCGRVKWSLLWKILGFIVMLGGAMYGTATASISNVEEKVIEQGKIQSAQTAQIAQIQRDIGEIKKEMKENSKVNRSIDYKLDKLIEENRGR